MTNERVSQIDLAYQLAITTTTTREMNGSTYRRYVEILFLFLSNVAEEEEEEKTR